jgi:hypothetical protein
MNIQDESIKELLKKIPTDVRQLIELKIEILQLQFTERFALIAGKLLYKVIGALLLYLGLILLLWAGGFFLGQVLNNLSAGFAILALFIILVGFILFKYPTNGMIRSAKNKIIKSALESDEDEKSPPLIEQKKSE